MGAQKVTIITDAGFYREWFNRFQSNVRHLIGKQRREGVLKLSGTEERVTPG